MTSSLVGSEMCIRDSPGLFALLCSTSPADTKHFEEELMKDWEAFCAAPVSYTHLTLPTICSV
eukprot:209844-Prorocentrum_lima.AAC.1